MKNCWVIKIEEFKSHQKYFDKSWNLESLKKWLQKFESFSTNITIVGQDLPRTYYRFFFFPVLSFKWSVKKHCVTKVLLAIWEIILRENNCNYNSYRFSCKFFILFLSFLTNQKQESGFQQVVGLVTRNISVFCLLRVALCFKTMLNSIDFYGGIFLLVILVRIIVP